MIVIGGSSNFTLAENIANKLSLPFIKADIQKFEDQELRVRVKEDLKNKKVIIVQSTSKPANDNLIELLLIADIAKRAGAAHITAVISYFGYGRQDNPHNFFEPVSANLVANLIECSGINKVITLDSHSNKLQDFFKIKIENINSFNLFSSYINITQSTIIVSPDIGGKHRAKSYSDKLSCELAIINKIRISPGECNAIELIGNVKNKHCIIIDDIIDTANTICNATELLYSKGALSVEVCATHAVLSKDAIDKLNKIDIKKIYVSNSINLNEISIKMIVVSCIEIIAAAIKKEIQEL